MPYTEPHWLITVGGDAWSQTETWQFGIRARVQGGANQPVDQQLLADALATPTNALFSSLAVTTQARLLWIKAASINSDGHYSYTEPPGLYTYAPAVAGTGAIAPAPQVAIACTTLTAQARGRAARGRFYLPPISKTVASDGRMSITDADALEGACRTWINAINATAQVSNCAVMSKLGAGTTNNITAVGVGRVFDTMRSRRRSLPEGRTPLAL